MHRRPALALALPLTLALTACGTDTVDGSPAAGEGPGLQVVASFYPLEYLVQRVAGEHAEITTLTAPGVDPHDVELSPRTVGSLGAADLVVFESGMQPAVDDAVDQQAPASSFDVTPVADLLALGESEDEHGEHAGEDEAGQTDEAEVDGHGHGAEDPHFWLDPVRYGDVAQALALELAAVDPANAQAYETNAAALVSDLQDLDAAFSAGLQQCTSRQVVTTHEAFGYLGARYDLEVTGITGISPQSEPSPARLAEVAQLVRELDVSTVYAEPLLSPAIARTVASETGTEVLTLDPADGLSGAGSGTDYLDIMRANLTTLRAGQGCS